MTKIRVVVCRVGQPPIIEEIDRGVEAMQEIVGGMFELMALDNGLDLWFDEDARAKGKPLNSLIADRIRAIKNDVHWIMPLPPMTQTELEELGKHIGEIGHHKLYGDFFFSKSNKKGESISLTDKDILKVEALVGVIQKPGDRK